MNGAGGSDGNFARRAVLREEQRALREYNRFCIYSAFKEERGSSGFTGFSRPARTERAAQGRLNSCGTSRVVNVRAGKKVRALNRGRVSEWSRVPPSRREP